MSFFLRSPSILLQVLNEKSLHIRELVEEAVLLIQKSGHKIGKNIIHDFELEKHLPSIAEGFCLEFIRFIFIKLFFIILPVLDLTSPDSVTPERSGGNSSTGVPIGRAGNNEGGYASPGSQRNQPDWAIVDHLYDSPHLIYGILHGKIPKEIKELIKNACEDVKVHYSRQVFDILVQIIKTSLALIRRRFVGSKGSHTGSSMFHTSKWGN